MIRRQSERGASRARAAVRRSAPALKLIKDHAGGHAEGAVFDDPEETAIYADLVRRAVQATAANSVLDVGCGAGLATLEAARAGASAVVGIDIDPASVELTRTNIRHAGLAARVSAHLASWDDVRCGRFAVAPALVVSNPPYVPGGRGHCVDGGFFGTSMLHTIVDHLPASAYAVALLFGSVSDPLTFLRHLVARGFVPTHILAHSVNFGRYTSMPGTLSHLRRLRRQGRAFFCDINAAEGRAPHAYLTLGVVSRRARGPERAAAEQARGRLEKLGALLADYQERGPAVLSRTGPWLVEESPVQRQPCVSVGRPAGRG